MNEFDKLLEETPLTRTQWQIWGLSGMGVFLDGFDFFIIGVGLPLIVLDFKMDATTEGLVAVAAVFGSFLGALIFGPVTDKIGRKGMFLIDLFMFVCFALLSALAWDVYSLIVFRFLLGVGIGADYPIGVSYIAETIPCRVRGSMVVSAFSFQALGAITGVLVGLGVIYGFQFWFPDGLIRYGWRLMLGFGVIPAIIVILLRSKLPESPRWYLSRHEYDKASQAASFLLSKPVVLSASNSPVVSDKFRWWSLFSVKYLRVTIFCSVPWFLQDISTYGIGIFTPTILAGLVFRENNDVISQTIAAVQGSFWIDLLLLIGFGMAVVLIDNIGRISLQIIGFVGMAIGLILVDGGWVLAGFMIFNGLMNAGPNSTTYLISGEVWNTEIRATGAGFAAGFAKGGAIFGTLFFPILQGAIGLHWLLWLLVMACLLGAVVTYIFGVESVDKLLDEL